MKIDSHFKPPVLGNAPPQALKAPNPPPTGFSAEVRLSDAATRLASSDNSAPVNRAKIEEIKQAISQGRFKVNPEAIADELIATSRQLIESQYKTNE